MDEEAYRQHEANVDGARLDALQSLEQMQLPMTLELPPKIDHLHTRANQQYARNYERLKGGYPDLGKLFAYAQWVLWMSCWDGAHWFRRSIETGQIRDTEKMRACCSPEGYAAMEGWAYTAFNKMAEIEFSAHFSSVTEKFGYTNLPSDEVLLTALELHWLWRASDGNLPKPELLEALHEASEANSLSHGLHMWAESEKLVLESIVNSTESPTAIAARKALAKSAAKVRHAPTQAAREAVRQRYAGERNAFSSKDAAAIAYTKDYPFEFSTIRDWLKGV